MEPVEINLSLMLEQIADELYGVLQDKNLCCEVEVEENLEVTGDPDKLARVFDNILRNAIAYCYAGTKIQIYAQKKEDDVEIVFSNEGDKIPGTMLQTIFEKFYRVDGSRSSRYRWSRTGACDREGNRRTARWACACEEQRSEDRIYCNTAFKEGAGGRRRR